MLRHRSGWHQRARTPVESAMSEETGDVARVYRLRVTNGLGELSRGRERRVATGGGMRKGVVSRAHRLARARGSEVSVATKTD